MISFEAHLKTTLIPTETPTVNQIAVESKTFNNGPDPSKGHALTEKHVWGTWQNDIFNGGRYNWENVATAYHGGIGVDTVDYSNYSNTSADKINVSLKIGMSFSLSGRSQGDTYDSIENIIGTRWNDVIVGDDKMIGNTLDGSQGSDILFGEAGSDLIIGGGGVDTMWGGSQDDTFRFFYGHSTSYITPDVIKDFDQNGDDVLEFVFDKPAEATWRAEAWVHDGVAGTMVFGTEEVNSGPFDRFAVFLEGTDVSDVGADDFAFI
ncbi:MAG: hypothetical protein AAF409_02045 [Pseudomonadota bacterium]